MQQADWDKALLALALWREARGEGAAGMISVGCVLRNRKGTGNWTNVITAKNQLTSISVHDDPETTLWPHDADPSWHSAMQIVDGLVSGATTDVTHGAQYYANVSNVAPGWFKTNIIGKPNEHPVTVVIGNHTFYR